jgi:hypothetical protein
MPSASQALVNVLSVGPLAPGASVTLPHGLRVGGRAVAPTQVFPNALTQIVVSSASTTEVVFTNAGTSTASALFRCEYDYSAIAVGVAPTYWQGGKVDVVNAAAFTFYVDFAAGNDANDGLSLAAPKRTIQSAVSAAGPLVRRFMQGASSAVTGEVVIYVAAGTDTQSLQLTGPMMVSVDAPPEAYGVDQRYLRYSLDIRGAEQTVRASGTITSIVSADPLDPAPGVSPGHGGRQQLVCAGAAWVVDEHKGRIVKGKTAGGADIYATCSGNTANTLYISRGVSFTTVAPNNVVSLVTPATRLTNSTVFIGNGVMARIRDIEFDNSVAPASLISGWTNNEGNTISRVDLERCIVKLSQASDYETAIIIGAHTATVFKGRDANTLLYTDNLTRCTVLDVYYVNLGPSNAVGSKSTSASFNQHNYFENLPYAVVLVQSNAFVTYLYNSTFNFGAAGGSLALNGQNVSYGCLVVTSGIGLDCSGNASSRIDVDAITIAGAVNAVFVDVANSLRLGSVYLAGCANPIALKPTAILRLGGIAGLNTNTGTLITMDAASRCIYDAKPAASLGCAAQLTIDGVTTTFAAAPTIGVKGSVFAAA